MTKSKDQLIRQLVKEYSFTGGLSKAKSWLTNPLGKKVTQSPSNVAPPQQVAAQSTGSSGYSNKNLEKYLSALKSNPLFSGNLQQRVVDMLKASDNPNNPEDKASIATLKTFLIAFSKAISNASAQYRQSVGDPNAVRDEITKDPKFAALSEAAANLLAQNKDRREFIQAFNAAIPNLVGAAAELRQVFNKKNPNNIYKLPPKKVGVKIAPPVTRGLPAGFAPRNEETSGIEDRGKRVTGSTGNLTGPDIANARAMFARLIDLGPILQKVNPNSINRSSLKQLFINFLDIGDVLVYKKGSKKTNKTVDAALQGLDILGGTSSAPASVAPTTQAAQAAQPVQSSNVKQGTIIFSKKAEGPLSQNSVYSYMTPDIAMPGEDKTKAQWTVVSRQGRKTLASVKGFTPEKVKKIKDYLTAKAASGRDDTEELVNILDNPKSIKSYGDEFINTLRKLNIKKLGKAEESVDLFETNNSANEFFAIDEYRKFFL